jgi:hypothetical protein
MERRAAIRPLYRAPGLILIAVCALLLAPAAALAADGVQLYPPGVDAGYSACSMTNADLGGRMLAFELRPMDPAPPIHGLAAGREARGGGYAKYNPIIYGWNAANGTNWALGAEVAGWDADMQQVDPAVYDRAGTVFVAWSQRDDVADDWDIWLWKGSRAGVAAAGYPRLLIQGAAGTDQITPDLGAVTLGGGNELWLAWADDRDTGGATTEIYVYPVGHDSDGDGTLDIEEAGWNPSLAGLRMDPGGSLTDGQHDPSVGPKGVFWLDDRSAAGSGESAIWRGQPFINDAAAGKFCDVPAGSVKRNVCATASGAAWLGPGFAGGPFEPWGKDLGKAPHILTFLGDPGEFDASGTAYALTGRHDGTTDLDPDIFFYSPSLRQAIPVCNKGAVNGVYDHRLTQAMPTIAAAPGGYRVIWSDARTHYANAADTPEDQLAFRLYVALVPRVTFTTTKAKLHLGQSTKLVGKVSPDFKGYRVAFQKGTRKTFTTSFGKHEWFTAWKTLATKKLKVGSKGSWTWRPSKKGTYWIRVWFRGGRKYVDVASAGRKVPHVPMSSRIVKIVVK